jgi:hypothetical protein
MCQLICGWDNEVPTLDELERSCIANPDGFGFGVVHDTGKGLELIKRRSMDSQLAISEFYRVIEDTKPLAWLFHTRIATSGQVNESMCHPFKVGNDSETVLAHNGILNIKPRDGMSDTATLAKYGLPAMGGVKSLESPIVWSMFDTWCEDNYSKVALLSARSDLAVPLAIAGESLGKWEQGIWFSNNSHKASAYSYASTPIASRGGWMGWDDYIYEPVRLGSGRAIDLDDKPNLFAGLLYQCSVCQCETPLDEDECRYCLACLYCEHLTCVCPSPSEGE